MLIDAAWREYFSNPHEGLGTTYERFVLHKFFKELNSRYSIEKVLEAPSFGMTGLSGINSLWWAYKGAGVTVVDDDKERIQQIRRVWEGLSAKAHFVCQSSGFNALPFRDKSFDLGWNFASVRFVADLNSFLNELARVSSKVIFICVPNEGNVWSFLMRLSQGKEKDVTAAFTDPEQIVNIMDKLGWSTNERGYFDVPPWPDIAMKKEDFLRKIGFKKLAQKLEKGNEQCLCILDYFNGNNRNMESEMLRHGFLEGFPSIFKKFWAHHRYFIFVPRAQRLMATH
ncbi:MAG: biotin biosynthesis protein BioC [Syntrophorhabdus sp. PtaU1.Bin002]|nr:MAG: biotin biosynthesis protein BioC [Syntrophorhabdus sp. PtaB.Bin006]OPY71474.1 MAG: biotin biosynthesis protein BioC [Syntrophorhabdus sp. PtaU1.Bin002]